MKHPSANRSRSEDLQARLRLVNNFFPHRIYAADLSDEQDAALTELIALAQADDRAAFDPMATGCAATS